MKFKKRYFFFLLFAVLTFSNVIHFDDYCYDALNTFLFITFSVLFSGAFLIMTFYNLYKISLKKERFDFMPGILLLLFFSVVIFQIKYPKTFIFKTQIKSFKSLKKIDSTITKVILYSNNTFKSKTILKKSDCTKNGNYLIENDTLYLNYNNKIVDKVYFDNIYYYNQKEGLLNPKNRKLPVLKLE